MIDIQRAVDRLRMPYDIDAPVTEELKRLSYLDLVSLRDEFEGDWARTSRAHLRYLAALFPSLSLGALAQTIHDIVANPNLPVGDVRLILQGRSLADASRSVERVPVEAIQAVGQVLMRGGDKTAAARASRVSIDTVEAIDNFLGLTQRHEDRQMDAAVAAVREGLSVRQLADMLSTSKSTAHRLMQRARSVLVEIGEVAE
jgi:hypothetical protein